MAHIPDGVVSNEILVIGAIGTVLGLTYALKKLHPDNIPQTAMLSAVFFISSMITFPVGPSSVHLLLNGLMGLLLGWSAIPAIFIALILQLMFFGYGGVLILGVNTFNIALPAIIVALTLRPILLHKMSTHSLSPQLAITLGAMAGIIGILSTTLLLSASLFYSGQEFAPMMKVILATNIPLLIIEACITAAIVSFIVKASPTTFKTVTS